jgi:hypothetical protein
MPIDLFGFNFGKKKTSKKVSEEIPKSFVAPDSYDGAFTVETGGFFGTYVDFSGSIRDENQLINRYRSLALYPECDSAIEDIVNEAIVADKSKNMINIDLDNINLSDNIKSKITAEFKNVFNTLDFKNKGHEIFRRWYIDSKVYYHVILDNKNPLRGILELRPIDPVKIKKIRKIEKKHDRNYTNTGNVPLINNIDEFFVYTNTDKDSIYQTTSSGIKIHKDSIIYSHSGVVDSSSKKVVGYLQKALRPLNMLRQIEDAVVIYRISRAPERRIFYIDVGNLPKHKAEQYIRGIMNKYRNKLVYDSATGEVRDDRQHLHMLEDFWLPRREGGRGTEIQTLSGGENLGEMDDVDYLLRKLYKSLNVPISRLESENGFNMGRSAEITRDEVKFYKFIDRLQHRFSALFLDILRIQLLCKGIITENDWKGIKQDISFIWNKDNYFSELKENELIRERLDMLNILNEYIGSYYSVNWIRRTILKQDDFEIEQMDKEIEKEREMGLIQDQEEEI